MKFHKIRLEKPLLEKQRRTWQSILIDILNNFLNRRFPVKPTQQEIDVWKNGVDPHIHEELLTARRPTTARDIPQSPATQQLHPDARVLGIRQRAMMHQVYPHHGDALKQVAKDERKRFITRDLNPQEEGTHKLEPQPYNPRFNAMMGFPDEAWLNDRKIS